MLSSSVANATSSSSVIDHTVVALVDEVLEPEARRAGADHPRRPRAEVLHPAEAHVGRVDVDPVVREPCRLRDDERDGEEVAVRAVTWRPRGPPAAAAGPSPGSARRAASTTRRRRTARPRSPSAHRRRRWPVPMRHAITGLSKCSVGAERRSTRSRHASHIIPGPSWGYWNSSISDVDLAARRAADGVAHGAAERQALDPLRRPVGRHLVGRACPTPSPCRS